MKATPLPERSVAVAEHHGLHVDCGAAVAVKSGVLSVGAAARCVPRCEDGADGRRQLLAWIVGERRSVVCEKGAAHFSGVRTIPVGELIAALKDDPAVHEEEPPIAVPGEVLAA